MRARRKDHKIGAAREPLSVYGRPGGEVVFYRSRDGKETIWLSQKQMAVLFGKDTDTLGLHIRNAFTGGELANGQLPTNPR